VKRTGHLFELNIDLIPKLQRLEEAILRVADLAGFAANSLIIDSAFVMRLQSSWLAYI